MKTLYHMNNLDRAYLLARLFPQELQELTEFIKKQAELWRNQKPEIEKKWIEKNIDLSVWYDYITNFERRYLKNGTRLYRNKKRSEISFLTVTMLFSPCTQRYSIPSRQHVAKNLNMPFICCSAVGKL